MRHRVSGRKLSRTASHRKALMRSLATELIRHKRIRTTEAKAKEASKYVEGLIARAKRAHLKEEAGDPRDHSSRRHIARDIQDKGVLRELFEVVAPKVAARSGGFTRVVRTGRRQGDGAEMAVLELVDYNLEQDESAVRSRTKRTISRAERVRRSQQKAAAADETAADVETEETAVADDVVEEADVETVAEDAPAAEAEEVESSSSDDAPNADDAEEDAPVAEVESETAGDDVPAEEAPAAEAEEADDESNEADASDDDAAEASSDDDKPSTS